MLTHTAGVRHYGNCFCFPVQEFYSKKNYATIKQSVDQLSSSPLLFKPGTDFSYSSYGFVLASAVIEEVAGKPFAETVEEWLTDPLGMDNTLGEPDAVGDYATSYDIRGDEFKKAFPVNNSGKIAGGGFVSTPTDLVLMTQAILTDSYLSLETLESLLYSPQLLNNGDVNEQFYALGWRSHESTKMFGGERPVHIVHHGGTAMGGTAFLVMFPDYDLSMAIMVNRTLNGSGELFDLLVPIAEDFILASEIE